MKPDREKFKQWLTKLVVMKAAAKGTTPTEELNLLRLEALNRDLKKAGLLKDETPKQNQQNPEDNENLKVSQPKVSGS